MGFEHLYKSTTNRHTAKHIHENLLYRCHQRKQPCFNRRWNKRHNRHRDNHNHFLVNKLFVCSDYYVTKFRLSYTCRYLYDSTFRIYNKQLRQFVFQRFDHFSYPYDYRLPSWSNRPHRTPLCSLH